MATSILHANGKTRKRPKLTAAQKAEKKIKSYIHGHRRHGSPISHGATRDVWHNIGRAKGQG